MSLLNQIIFCCFVIQFLDWVVTLKNSKLRKEQLLAHPVQRPVLLSVVQRYVFY